METETAKKVQTLMDEELIKVLLVEDDAIDRKLVELALAGCPQSVEFVIDHAGSISEAVEQLENRKHDVVLLDLMLPDSSGIDTVQRVHEINPRIPIIVLTGLDEEQAGLSAIEKAATDYLVKGQSLDNILVRTILCALARKNEIKEWWRTFDAISDLVFIQDKDSTITKANKAFLDSVGLKREDVIGKKCYEVFHNRDAPWPSCPFEKSRLYKKPHSEEVDDPHIGFPLLISTSPILDDDGEFVGSVHVSKDISKQKRNVELLLDINRSRQETAQKLFNAKRELEKKNAALEQAKEVLEERVKERTIELSKANENLQNTEANLRTMIKQNADGIIIVDRKGIMRFVNDAAESLFGRKSKELVGEIFGFTVIKDETMEIELACTRGELVTVEIRVVEIVWEGEMVYLASLRNITERKKAEEKLKETIKMKSEFTSVVSHELRTPLTAIKEGIGLVVDGFAGEINEEQKELLDISKKNVGRLAKLINDVLDFQKIESGMMTFNMTSNNINEIARDVCEMMASSAKNTVVDLLLELDEDVPNARFDSDKVTQVLTNLVSNALKFTEKGNITIKTSQDGDSIQCSVSDTGRGIRKEDLSKVFDKFEQLSLGGERKTGGTGLGLAISREIIEQHNGAISVESVFGKGSKFIFTLPIHSR